MIEKYVDSLIKREIKSQRDKEREIKRERVSER